MIKLGLALRRALPALVVVLGLPLLGGSSCKKGEPPADEARPAELPPISGEPPEADKKPVEGAKLDALKDDEKKRFETLVDKLPSPCGKTHSLRTSRNTDASCARAPFAVSYVTALIEDGASDEDVQNLYMSRYPSERKVAKLDVSAKVPHTGPDDARVVVVEFYDYGCPACAEFAPVLREVQEAYPRDVAVYYKQFPITAAHPDSGNAAQAALAAGKQGKFKEMHELLFENLHAHKKSDVDGYARKLGLDMAKFEADFAAASAQVDADRTEGNAAGVQGTPTAFLNGVRWEGPSTAKYLKMWVDEELALNR